MKFDEFYSRQPYYFGHEHSDGMAEYLETYAVSPCVAIDIGAGEGRNSFYLASRGFDVIAIEPSVIGAKKMVEKSSITGIPVKVVATDFLSAITNLNDVGFVLALTSLDHMDYEYMLKTVEEIKRILIVGGCIYAMVLTEDDPGFTSGAEASECSAFIKHYFKKNELRDLFSDFEILKYSEYTKEDTTHGAPHYHGKAKLFAMKK